MTNDDRNGVSAEPEKIDPEEQLPDQPEQELPDPELPAQDLPDLTRLYKRRCRDESVIKKAKSLLVHGMTVSKVALLLRLPLEKVQQLHSEGWNSRCRRVTPHNAWTCQKLAIQCFGTGCPLVQICRITDRPLFSVIKMLTAEGVSMGALRQYMPPETDPLMVEYRKTLSRHEASPKRRPIKINPVRRSRTASATA
ncbi:hypothetical protein [Citrobacter freundii]|uniref:hypothetical protein n=1 Tax=Enterobacteriaceae TaxID=543 RepID=UPI001C70803F|nr:hypothetical protein [Citrobacter freundii]MBW9593569.1 hypothetical protein [Citrobacter freundii]HBR4580724.1 hypothetical protein [Klebsiella pneumoniae]